MLVEKTLTIKKNITEVFEGFYENNEGIFDKHMKLMEWKKDDWKMKKNIKQRKEFVYVYIDTLPDELVNYLKENDKYLQLEVKNKIMVDTPKYQKIKTKFNDLHLVNIKNTIELTQEDDQTTSVKVTIKVQIKIPKTKVIENFVTTLINKLVDSAITVFTTVDLQHLKGMDGSIWYMPL